MTMRDNLRAGIAVGSLIGFAWFVWPPLVLLVIGLSALTGEIVDWYNTHEEPK